MSDKKKHKRKKPLSEEEKKLRIELHNQRIKFKKHKRRMFYIKILLVFLSILLLITMAFFLGYKSGSNAVHIYIAVILIIFALLSDRSGIRTFLFSKYPNAFPFSESLKKDNPNRSFMMELARTCFYISLALFFSHAPFSKVFAIIMIIAIVIGFYYLITDIDDCYTFDKFSKGSDTTIFLIIGGLFALEMMSEYSFHVPIEPIVIGTLVLFALYAVFARNPHKGELLFEMLVFAPLDIMLIWFLISSL
jgi:hypothetical protein